MKNINRIAVVLYWLTPFVGGWWYFAQILDTYRWRESPLSVISVAVLYAFALFYVGFTYWWMDTHSVGSKKEKVLSMLAIISTTLLAMAVYTLNTCNDFGCATLIPIVTLMNILLASSLILSFVIRRDKKIFILFGILTIIVSTIVLS